MRLGQRSRSVSAAVSGGGTELLGSHTVSGSAKQTIIAGSGGDSGLSSISFTTGRRYRIEARIFTTTPAPTHLYTIRPAGATTNMYYQRLGGSNTLAVGDRNAWIAGTSTDIEEYAIALWWDELSGFDRIFNVRATYYDASVPLSDQIYFSSVVWAQTPAETAMSSFALYCDQADGFGVGTYVAVFDDGACA